MKKPRYFNKKKYYIKIFIFIITIIISSIISLAIYNTINSRTTSTNPSSAELKKQYEEDEDKRLCACLAWTCKKSESISVSLGWPLNYNYTLDSVDTGCVDSSNMTGYIPKDTKEFLVNYLVVFLPITSISYIILAIILSKRKT
jgi:hypothetical protein